MSLPVSVVVRPVPAVGVTLKGPAAVRVNGQLKGEPGPAGPKGETGAAGSGLSKAEAEAIVNAKAVLVTGNQTVAGTKTFTGEVAVPFPANPADAASKEYVDATINGLNAHANVLRATTEALPASTYAAGVITGTAFGALSINGAAGVVGKRYLVKNETLPARNGIYTLTAAGGVAELFVLTRATDMDEGSEVASAYTFVEAGSLEGTGWFTPGTAVTLGTTPIVWSQLPGIGDYVAGSGIAITGNQIAVSPSVASGRAVGVGYNGLLWNAAKEEWEEASLASQPASTTPTQCVEKTGNDSNSGLLFGNAKKTITAARDALAALSGGTGQILVGVGVFTEEPLIGLPKMTLKGAGEFLTEIVQKANTTGNVYQSAKWGTEEQGEGGLISDLTLNGNLSNQTMQASAALVRTEIALSGAAQTLAVLFTVAGFPAEGKIWIGTHICTYTGIAGETFTGVKALFGNFTATPEMLVVPFMGNGHGLAVGPDSRFKVERVITKNCVASGRCIQGSHTGICFEYKDVDGRSEKNGRYDIEVMTNATDGHVTNWVGDASERGSIFVGGPNWTWTSCHPTGGVTSTNLPAQAIHICAGRQKFRDLYIDSAPYDCIRLDACAQGSNLEDIEIQGQVTLPSIVTNHAGVGVFCYGNNSSFKAARIVINMSMNGHVLCAIHSKPEASTVGTQNLEAPPEGKVQVLSVHRFSRLGSSVGGVINVAAGGTLNYETWTRAHSYLTAAAEENATTLKLHSTAELAPSGKVCLARTGVGLSEGGVYNPIVASYTEIVGNELRGVTGITEELANNTGVTQCFLTGVTGGTGAAVAETQLSQAGRTLNPEGEYNFRTNQNRFGPNNQNLSMRASGSNEGTPNPQFVEVTIASGKTEGSVTLPTNIGAAETAHTTAVISQTKGKAAAATVKLESKKVVLVLAAAAGEELKYTVLVWTTSV